MLNLEKIDEILSSRIDKNDISSFKDLPNSDNFKDMSKSTKRIKQAIQNNEKINIVGDYDVDGVISTTIIVDFFEQLNIKVNHIIPNRFEHGYGLSPKIIDMIDDGIIITVDNGISAVQSAKLAKDKGLDLIITDHHTVGKIIPDAYAIINPKQSDCKFEFKEICGAQVAWYLCAGLKKELNLNFDLSQYFDLMSVAIIADIMPMRSINKLFVKKGLKAIQSSQRTAFLSLKKHFYLYDEVIEDDIGFKIAPLINCAGRLSDAKYALNFFLSKTQNEAKANLEFLVELNEQRKYEQQLVFEQACMQVKEQSKVIVVYGQDWNEGVIGIVASKLCDKYNKSAFVFSKNGDIAKGSCRCVNDTNLYLLIERCSECVVGFGGHKSAAGVAIKIEKLPIFEQLLNKYNDEYMNLDYVSDDILGTLDISLVNENLLNTLQKYSPYGLDNAKAVFAFENLKIIEIKKIGKNSEFTKLKVSNGNCIINMLVFEAKSFELNSQINFIATVMKNTFRNNTTYELLYKSEI